MEVVYVCVGWWGWGGGGVIHPTWGRGKYKHPGINEQSNKYVLHYKTKSIK